MHILTLWTSNSHGRRHLHLSLAAFSCSIVTTVEPRRASPPSPATSSLAAAPPVVNPVAVHSSSIRHDPAAVETVADADAKLPPQHSSAATTSLVLSPLRA
ncbi:hypothetical protein M0R45_025962 [Rubus argutus]|uniref:Uncharacterized protein n=1 Tax=Rubus argutus TaxID=59490 RepID=A0AAW1WWU1_RUBAR